MSLSTIDRLYSSLINDIDYKDLPEAEKARDKVKACIMNGYLRRIRRRPGSSGWRK